MKRPICFSFLLLVAVCIFVSPVNSQSSDNEENGIEEVVEIEEVEIIHEASHAAEPGPTELVGRLHPAFIHFPVAWLVILVIFEIVSLRSKDPYWSRASFVILFLTVLSFFPAMTTGFLLEETAGGGPGFHDLLELHETLNIIAASILAAGFLIQLFLVRDDTSPWKKAYLVCIFISTGLILYSAHVGGKMVYGENFFPF